jgi:hypothetical protein
MTAPVGSVTVPRMFPVICCADRLRQVKTDKPSKFRTTFIFVFRLQKAWHCKLRRNGLSCYGLGAVVAVSGAIEKRPIVHDFVNERITAGTGTAGSVRVQGKIADGRTKNSSDSVNELSCIGRWGDLSTVRWNLLQQVSARPALPISLGSRCRSKDPAEDKNRIMLPL